MVEVCVVVVVALQDFEKFHSAAPFTLCDSLFFL